MEIAYLHLVTNHIPIIGVPFAVALLAYGIWRKSDEVKTAAFVAFVLIGIATIGVYLLGQGGEDFIEDLLASVLVLAAVSVFALLRYGVVGKSAKSDDDARSVLPTWIALVVLAIGVVSTGVIGYTGRLGGKIRHPEFHQGTQANAENETNGVDAETDNEGGRRRGRNRGER
jgi:uncharacterized membrane protein YfcA